MPGDKNYKIWKALAHVFIDKTERHFDADLSELKRMFDTEENMED